jgi:hypothetical protein
MMKRRIPDVADAQNVDTQDGVERAALALMLEFHRIDVVWRPARLLGDGENLNLRQVDAPKAIAMNNAAAGAVAVQELYHQIAFVLSDFAGCQGLVRHSHHQASINFEL